jgi:tricorn protease-like protein
MIDRKYLYYFAYTFLALSISAIIFSIISNNKTKPFLERLKSKVKPEQRTLDQELR